MQYLVRLKSTKTSPEGVTPANKGYMIPVRSFKQLSNSLLIIKYTLSIGLVVVSLIPMVIILVMWHSMVEYLILVGKKLVWTK